MTTAARRGGPGVHYPLPSTDTITSPADERATPTPVTRLPGGQGERPGFRVLVADANEHARDLYAFGLQRFGFEIYVAAAAQDAIDFVTAGLPLDCVLLDMDAPHVDALNLIGHLRTHAATRMIAAVAISADLTHKPTAFLAGFNAFCLKPCLADDVMLQVIKLLLPRALTVE